MPGPGPERGYRTVVANAEFRAVLAAQVLAALAIVGADVALAVLIYSRTGSPLLAAATFAAGFVPMGVGAVLFGGVGRTRPARDVLVGCELLTALVVVAMTAPGVPIPVQLGLLAVQGLIAPVYSGTRAATLPELVGIDGYPQARSVLRLVSQNAQLVGFAAGGAALTVVDPVTALAAAAAGHATAALILLTGTRRRPAVAGGAARRGPAALRGVPLSALAMFWAPVFFAVAPAALVLPYAAGDPAAVGLLLAAGPVGALLGELATGSVLTAAQRERWIVPLGLMWFAPVLGFAFDPPVPVAAVLLVTAGLGIGHLQGLDQVSLRAVPPGARRETFALLYAGQMTAQGLGYAAAGAAAEHAAPQVVIPLAALGGVAAVLVAGSRLTRRC